MITLFIMIVQKAHFTGLFFQWTAIQVCFSNISNKFSCKFRIRSNNVSPNCKALLVPSNDIVLLKSKSESKSTKETAYDFFCKNISSNLKVYINKNDDISLNQTILSMNENNDFYMNENNDFYMNENNDFDIYERIIPDYYINNDGIKVGPFNFDFYESIIDSIRNLRTLSKYQV